MGYPDLRPLIVLTATRRGFDHGKECTDRIHLLKAWGLGSNGVYGTYVSRNVDEHVYITYHMFTYFYSIHAYTVYIQAVLGQAGGAGFL